MDIKETIADMKGIPTQDVLIKTLQEKTAIVTFLKSFIYNNPLLLEAGQ